MTISKSSLVLGVLLVLVGVALFVSQFLGVDLGRWGWPFLVIIPGLAMLAWGVAVGDAAGEGMSLAGAMVSMTGLILLYQQNTGHWATWAYAWALIAPGAVGLGQIVFGSYHDRPKMVRSGLDALLAGLTLFLILGLFFELVIGLSGFGIERSSAVLPAVLIGLGLVLLVRNLFKFGARPER